MKITLKQLLIFDAVATHGSLVTAAERLGMSVSAISGALKDLQIILKRPLFSHGVGRRLVITEEGRKMRSRVRSLLNEARDIEVGSETPLEGVLHIGASASIAETILPGICMQFLEKFPDVRLHVHSAITGELWNDIVNFRLETALIEYFPDIEGIELVPWRTDELWLVTSPSHALANQTGLRVSDLAGFPWCARESNSSVTSRLRVLMHERIGQMSTPFVATSNGAVKQAAIKNAGIACLPRSMVEDDIERGRLTRLDISDFQFTRQLSLAKSRTMQRSRLAQTFDAFLLEHTDTASSEIPKLDFAS